MASNAMICAHNNVYNSAILGKDAYYFNNFEDVSALILSIDKSNHPSMLSSNAEKIRTIYSWDIITEQYLAHFEKIAGAIRYEKTVFKQVG
jgi:hypothetical protein